MGRSVHLRVEEIDYDALQAHFHMPMADAAKKFGVSLTLFKSICRKNGIQRWPHRKLRSLHNKIADLQNRLGDHPGGTEQHLRRRLDELQGLELPPGEGLAAVKRLRLDEGGEPPLESEESSSASSVKTNGNSTEPARRPPSSYEELKKHFYLPLTEAAKNSGVSSTVFKKICRKNGIRKWPHRKLKSLQSKITDLQARIQSNHGVQQEAELQRRLDELSWMDAEHARGLDFACQLDPEDDDQLETHVKPEPEEPDEPHNPLVQAMPRVQSVEMLCEMIQDSPGSHIPRIMSTEALCDMEKYAPPMSRVQSAEALCDLQDAGMITCWVGPEGWNENFSAGNTPVAAPQNVSQDWQSGVNELDLNDLHLDDDPMGVLDEPHGMGMPMGMPMGRLAEDEEVDYGIGSSL